MGGSSTTTTTTDDIYNTQNINGSKVLDKTTNVNYNLNTTTDSVQHGSRLNKGLDTLKNSVNTGTQIYEMK